MSTRMRGPFFPTLMLSLAACLGGCPSEHAADDARGHAYDAASADAGVDSPDGGADGDASALVIVTDKGPVQGLPAGATRAFLGIPYAAPPVGALRFAPPQEHEEWIGPRPATGYGLLCPQVVGAEADPALFGEDCLTLNIWTPSPAPAAPVPVLVWIHGGGFVAGGSSIELTAPPGMRLSEGAGVVVVSLNYRLGPLGFMAHPALGAQSGNFGLQDQQAALEWVRRNIPAFGGDPANVTILGESAGSMSVCMHMVSARSSGLFHRAVMESGECPQEGKKNSRVLARAAAEAQGARVAAALGCETPADIAACLRAAGVDEVLAAVPLQQGVNDEDGLIWGPHIDGLTLTGQPLDLVRAGTFHKVPVLLGSNANEWMFFFGQEGQAAMTAGEYEGFVNTLFGDVAGPMVLGYYPAAGYPDGSAALSALLTDLVFVCPTRRSARAFAAAAVGTYLYQFSRHPGFSPPGYEAAYHTAEIPFVFNTPPATKSFTAEELPLARSMMGYWTRFAATGDPGSPNAVRWPPYAEQTDEHLQLDLTIVAGAHLNAEKCDFWDALTD